MQSKLLLCDEPTSGLDIASIADVTDLLCTVNQMGISMIIASHDLNFLTTIANSIVILEQGHIIHQTDTSFPNHYRAEELIQYY